LFSVLTQYGLNDVSSSTENKIPIVIQSPDIATLE
jgi:hypothetical protein